MHAKPIGIVDKSMADCAAKFQLSTTGARLGDGKRSAADCVLIAYSTTCGHLFHAHVASHSMTCDHPREMICEAVSS